MLGIFSKLVDANAREVSRLSKIVESINELGSKISKLKDADFAKKTEEFKKRLKKGETLHDILPEAFAVSREASWRALGLRPYDTQLMAGIALFEGKIAEQKTGEGKTLSAVAPLYLRALTGKCVHLVTVNDYLARRDAGWNGPTFELLGLSVGSIIQEGKSLIFDVNHEDNSHGDERLSHLRSVDRREVYQADVVYGTNNEFGFDYLRDNMVSDLSQMVQRGHYFAIVDEVDSILIDEARTPLIISAPDTEPTDKYYKFASIVQGLSADTDYTIDEKTKTANLTEHGVAKVEKILGVDNLYEKDFDTLHHIENSLRARTLYQKDRDYVVRDNQIVIVDEFTGRLMFGRRWSDGLHQSVEAKEDVTIQQESRTLATISFQNYFRMYKHLSGMTGTAATEAEEFHKIYKLDAVIVPTYKPLVRKDHPDSIYKTARAKYAAVVGEINEVRRQGRPILVGTTSIGKNEIIAEFLKRKKVPHNILNAKNHEREATIIAEAGEPGAVTVATNMAGRGVDIILGGDRPDAPPGVDREKHANSKEYLKWKESHDHVVKAGGLHVIGTERHEARRIDNQLRGRSGRLGDPGSTKFFLSLEDDLMRVFGGEQISGLMETLKIPEDQPIENTIVSKAIGQAQVKVEGFHFDARKHLVEYDDVANQQREIIYKLRKKVLKKKNLKKEVNKKLKEQVESLVNLAFVSVEEGEEVDYERLLMMFLEMMPFDDQSQKRLSGKIQELGSADKITEFLLALVDDLYTKREKQLGNEAMRQAEKYSYLSSIDSLWMDHLDNLTDLREGVGLRGYGQKDPLVEFKKEAFDLFDKLMVDIDANMTRRIFRVVPQAAQRPAINLDNIDTNVDVTDATGLEQTPITKAASQQVSKNGQQAQKKLGRNDPCWCGSGKKFKKCHYPKYG
ncbi:preprotein translocase subunit SecA [Candidatus Woesebacteria bacterium]|nr:preprotein translocase subunit SecA [Candidatus Woesebacteria bacterium]|tara:strand:- start:371 stop:3088 length:2718 start_codon:yes stop_codon:yes gene_type:complete